MKGEKEEAQQNHNSIITSLHSEIHKNEEKERRITEKDKEIGSLKQNVETSKEFLENQMKSAADFKHWMTVAGSIFAIFTAIIFWWLLNKNNDILQRNLELTNKIEDYKFENQKLILQAQQMSERYETNDLIHKSDNQKLADENSLVRR